MIPTLEEFMSLPIDEVAKIAPPSVCFAPSGTRRAAAMLGIDPRSDQYVKWASSEELRCIDLLFQYGVKNVFAPIIVANNLTQDYSFVDRILDLARELITSDPYFDLYKRQCLSARLLCDDRDTKLSETAHDLQVGTEANSSKRLYWIISKTPSDILDLSIRKSRLHGANSQKDAIRATFGAYIDPITMLLSFGKLMVNGQIVPLALMGDLQCYFPQRPGYTLDDHSLRTILYDYAYLRPTAHYPKGDRAIEATKYANVWESAPTLGLGMRLGGSWFPAPMTSPAWEDQ
jgi:hypothetical protein